MMLVCTGHVCVRARASVGAQGDSMQGSPDSRLEAAVDHHCGGLGGRCNVLFWPFGRKEWSNGSIRLLAVHHPSSPPVKEALQQTRLVALFPLAECEPSKCPACPPEPFTLSCLTSLTANRERGAAGSGAPPPEAGPCILETLVVLRTLSRELIRANVQAGETSGTIGQLELWGGWLNRGVCIWIVALCKMHWRARVSRNDVQKKHTNIGD
jgi:hypothetical protein